jgi:predicted oxidoreductase
VQVDLAVVGAGGAGLAAAMEAARRGARVVVVDASTEAGGTARTAGGGTCIAGSPLQHELGLEDSPEVALEDWVNWGGDAVDEEWARRYLEASVPELYEGFGQLGIRWVGVRPNEGNRYPRWHEPRGGGRAVTAALEEAVRTADAVAWRLGSQVREVLRTGGRVTGVVVEEAGVLDEITATSVLIATGGFNNNPAMVREHATAATHAGRLLCGGGLGARGAGHGILACLGARFVNMDAVWMYPYGTPDPEDPSGERGLAVRGLEGDLWVNAAGERFHDETRRGGATGTPALLAQPEATCWSIIDSRIAARVTVADPRYRTGLTPDRARVQRLLDTSPYITTAGTLRDLAVEAGIDPHGLIETAAAVNRWVDAGLDLDPDFGRPLEQVEGLRTPPFYAVRFFPLARKNLGGVRTDLDCQVLDTENRPIPGLYAVGEVAGMAGGRINGRAALEGTMFGPSCYSGLVAGRNVAA